MIFFVHSQINQAALVTQLGLPQYSYFFVLDKFIPLLERLGRVVILEHPEDADAQFDAWTAQGETCVFLSFTPPHYSYTPERCPTLTVFAWEFTNLPDETWEGETGRSWQQVFAAQAGAIPLSTHTEELVRQAMGPDYAVKAIPVPVWDSFEQQRRRGGAGACKERRELSVSVQVIDSHNYIFGEHEFRLLNPDAQFNFPDWDHQTLRMSYSVDDEHAAYLGGFYDNEPWGTWSRLPDPWILLPVAITGNLTLEIEAAAYGPNVGRTISVQVGDQLHSLTLQGAFQVYTLAFQVSAKTCLIKFHDLSLRPVRDAVDPRTMGLGLRHITLRSHELDLQPCTADTPTPTALCTLSLEGVVYTSVLNPTDHRKNWLDMVTAFCYAFRDCSDATLILKMTHRSLTPFLGKLHLLLEQCQPFKCRVIALHGYLDKTQFDALIDASTYYVSASLCEGLCLPLMEFMSCGVPALATRNTAMLDYVDDDSNFIIDSSAAPTIWPHDPRNVIRTLQNRVNWQSIVDAYWQSYEVAKQQPERYQSMARCSTDKMREFCSLPATEAKLRQLLAQALNASTSTDSKLLSKNPGLSLV